MASVIAVCTSSRRGTTKTACSEVLLIRNHGIQGDAHAGKWHRQVSLLALESTEKMKNTLPDLRAGAFAENILTEGICLHSLEIGTQLQVGDAVLEVTQIGKECHSDCEIRRLVGDCVMPREGIFTRVLKGGMVHVGDEIKVL